MSSGFDIGKIIKQAQEQGFRYRRTEKNHHQFYAPNGKDIIVCSGTSSNWRGEENFMHDMKAAGYVHGLNSLGDALSAAGVSAPKAANGGAKLSVVQLIIDALARHPDGMSAVDLRMVVNSQRPELSGKNKVYSGLNTVVTKGYVKKWPNGNYRLTDVDRSNFRTYGRNRAAAADPAGLPKTNGAHNPTVGAGARTGDSAIDEDLAALDGALAALARIETVVRKNREVLVQFAKLKAMLIYRESGYSINPARFYDANDAALADMKRLADEERAAGTQP